MYRQRTMFAETDLVMELAQLVRTSRRANVIFYSIDPRGLDAGLMDAASANRLTTRDMAIWMTQTQGTLKILGNETGGFCICDVNEIKPELKRIDNETSNDYVLGYTTTNSDPRAIRHVAAGVCSLIVRGCSQGGSRPVRYSVQARPAPCRGRSFPCAWRSRVTSLSRGTAVFRSR